MLKKVSFAAATLAAVGFSSAAFAADVGRVTWVSNSPAAKTSAVLPGQTGAQNNPYKLEVIGSVPTSVAGSFTAAEKAAFAGGTDLVVSLDIPSASSFQDFVTFTIPAPSSTTTGVAAFNIQVFSTIVSAFTYYEVSLFAGAPTFSPAGPALSNLKYGGVAQILPTLTGSFNDQLSAGDYFLYIQGTALGVSPMYELQVVANPVPEPGTYAMLLAGLGAVGFVARRRQLRG